MQHVAAPVQAPFQQAHFQVAPQGGCTVPPILSLTVPYGGGGYYQGLGGRALGGRERGQGSGCGCERNTFSPASRGESAIFVPGGSQVPPRHIPPMLAHDLPNTTRMNSPHSNITKKFNNWNVCYSCRFDIEDAHMSITCLSHWRRTGHDKGYTCTNAQSYLDQGYDMSTEGMHKMALPE